jgi:hypothetical protein
MSWCSDAPEDEAISLFAGLLANPDVRLSPQTKGLPKTYIYSKAGFMYLVFFTTLALLEYLHELPRFGYIETP